MWFKKGSKSKIKSFIKQQGLELSPFEKMNNFIDDFNEQISKGNLYLSTDFSKAACNITEDVFFQLQNQADKDGYILTKEFDQYKTVTIYRLKLKPQ